MGELKPKEECHTVTIKDGGEAGESSSSVMEMSGWSGSMTKDGVREVGKVRGAMTLPAVKGRDEGDG